MRGEVRGEAEYELFGAMEGRGAESGDYAAHCACGGVFVEGMTYDLEGRNLGAFTDGE